MNDSSRLAVAAILTAAVGGCGAPEPSVEALSQAAIAATYSVRAIPPLAGATSSFGYAINDDGVVAGASTLPGSTTTRAIRWVPGSSVQNLGALAGGYSSAASGINQSRQVAGNCGVNTLYSHACVYVEGTGFKELPHLNFGGLTPGFVSYSAGTINNAGQIAGFSPYLDAQFNQLNGAVRWQGSSLLDLSSLAAVNGTAVNDRGWETGAATAQTGLAQAMIYDGVKVSVLGVLAGTSTSVGNAINHAGDVAGTSILPANFCPGYPKPCVHRFRHAFLYTAAGGLRDLGTLGGANSTAYALDAGDLVVGKADTASAGSHAFAWAAGTLVDLNDRIASAGWVLEEARGINASGQIVGNGTLNGAQRGFLLTP